MLPKQKIGTVGFQPVYWKTRNTHCFISGKSGEGKSVLMLLMMLQDYVYRNALILIDPSGSLARDAYSIFRGEADYCSRDNPINFNPMMSGYDPDVIVSTVFEILNQACSPDEFSATKPTTVKMFSIGGEAIKHALNNNRLSLLAVLDYIINMKGSPETRDGLIHRFKFVLGDEKVNKIICGTTKPIRWGEFIEQKKRLILDTHGMTREGTLFTGNLITHGIKNYFRFERREKYSPVSIYVDECHNFTNPYWFDILKEGRKYAISAILSTQDFTLLSSTMKRILLNCGTLIAFRAGGHEAAALAKEMDCSPQAIQFVDKYHCAYLTTESRGFCKVPRPPIFKKFEPKVVEPPIKAKGWFSFSRESYQQTNSQ